MLPLYNCIIQLLTLAVLGHVLSDSVEGGHPSLESRQTSTGPCATGVHVIASSGDGANNKGGYGLIITLVSNITQAIPGSDNVTLPYPKGSPHNVRKTEKGVSTT